MLKPKKISTFGAFFARLWASTSGASMLEYGLIVFLIGIVLIGVLEAIGVSIIDILGVANEGLKGKAG